MGIPYLYDPSQQIVRMEGEELSWGIKGARALCVNHYEFGLIKKMTGLDIHDITGYLEFVVVTCGEKGSVVYAGGEEYQIPVIPPTSIVDPTGIGDAFRGGFLIGYGRGMKWETCGQLGALAATYCLEQQGPQGHFFTPAEFIARFRQHYDDAGQLDQLLPHS